MYECPPPYELLPQIGLFIKLLKELSYKEIRASKSPLAWSFPYNIEYDNSCNLSENNSEFKLLAIFSRIIAIDIIIILLLRRILYV